MHCSGVSFNQCHIVSVAILHTDKEPIGERLSLSDCNSSAAAAAATKELCPNDANVGRYCPHSVATQQSTPTATSLVSMIDHPSVESKISRSNTYFVSLF